MVALAADRHRISTTGMGKRQRLTAQGGIGCQPYTAYISVLAFLQQLEGFDSDTVIEAMSSTSNNVFLVWNRSAR